MDTGIGYWDSLTSLGHNGFAPALLSRPLDQLLEGLHRGFVPEAIEGPVLSAIVPKLVPLATVRQNVIEGNLSGVVPDLGARHGVPLHVCHEVPAQMISLSIFILNFLLYGTFRGLFSLAFLRGLHDFNGCRLLDGNFVDGNVCRLELRDAVVLQRNSLVSRLAHVIKRVDVFLL